MRSKIQEKTLAGKPAFEIWAATFGVQIKGYHAEKGRFNEQPSRSEIEYANQTITFCGVGSHHQNSIIERKVQTVTLGARIFILHAKIYWPEAITPMLFPYVL